MTIVTITIKETHECMRIQNYIIKFRLWNQAWPFSRNDVSILSEGYSKTSSVITGNLPLMY